MSFGAWDNHRLCFSVEAATPVGGGKPQVNDGLINIVTRASWDDHFPPGGHAMFQFLLLV